MVTGDAFGEHLGVVRELTSPEGRSWLASLPAVVASLEHEWQVRTGSPYTRGTAAWTAPATTADGHAAVLKVGVIAHIRVFADLVDVPAERMLAWGVARSVESALWEVEMGRPGRGEDAMGSARMLAGLLSLTLALELAPS